MTDAQRTFDHVLRRAIEEVRPAFIAEEDSEEALVIRQRTSIAKSLADEHRIEHRFCDPTPAQREAMNYKDGQTLIFELLYHNRDERLEPELKVKGRAIEIVRYFPVREQFWLERLNGLYPSEGIFVCGDAHIENFGRLLESKGIGHRVVQRGIGLTQEDITRINARRYNNIRTGRSVHKGAS